MRHLTVITGAIVGLLISVYGFLPWLVGMILPSYVIGQAGIEQFELEIGYPGFGDVMVERLALQTRGQSLEIQDLRLSYTPETLLEQRADHATMATAVLTWTEDLDYQTSDQSPAQSPDQSSDQSEEPPANLSGGDRTESLTEPVGLSIANLFSLIPFNSATVDALTVAVPKQGFLATGQLELNRDVLDLTLNGQTPEIARDLQLNARISADGQVHVAFRDPDAELPSALSIDAVVDTDRLQVRADLQLAGYGFRLIQEILSLKPLRALTHGQLSATLNTALPWPLQSWPDWRTLDGTGSFEFDGSFDDLDTRLKGIEGVVNVVQGQIDLDLSADVLIQLDAVKLTGRMVDGRFRFSEQTLSSEQPGIALQIVSPDVEASYQLQRLELNLADEPILDLDGSLTVTASGVELDGRVETRTRQIASNTIGDLSFDGMAKLDREAFESYPLVVSGEHTISDQQMSADVFLSSGALQSVPLEIRHDQETSAGSISTNHRQHIYSPLLAALIPNWQPRFDLNSGTLTVDGELAWGEAITGRVAVNTEAVSASFDDYRATGLNGDLNATLVNGSWTLQPSKLSIELIDIGVPVSELTMEISGNLQELRFQNLQARVLGGTVRADGFDYHVENGATEILLQLNDLELTEVLALEGEDVTGSGRLGGTMPISVNQNIARISGGRMTASEVGHIRLSPELAATITQPGLDIALKALEDFSYERLETSIDYDDNGDMRLGIRLEGSNPDLEGGRSVHFNLNISENLPVLLESLGVEDTIVKQIEKKVRYDYGHFRPACRPCSKVCGSLQSRVCSAAQ
jgi:hypothetical protein